MRPKILYSLFSNIISIKVIGPKYAKLIERLCGNYLIDLIFHKPTAYIDRRNNPKISELKNKFGELVIDAAGKVIEKEVDENFHSDLIKKALEKESLKNE